MSPLQRRLLVTLRYSWVFGFPLKAGEWVRRLYQSPIAHIHRSDATELANTIVSLVQANRVKKDGVFFSPVINEKTFLLSAIRAERLANSQRKLAEIEPLIKLCRWLPWVKGVAITGSVAVNNAKPDDDVDFMVVCAHRRLWLVRPLLILFSQRYGKRRTWWGEEGNSWCFNLWTEEISQRVESPQRSLYTAYEVCQAKWVISKDGTQRNFLLANRWVKRLLPHLYAHSAHSQAAFARATNQLSLPFVNQLLDLLNWLSFKLQFAYMRPHMTRERVSLHFAAFHPRETAGHIGSSLGYR